jgi:hypothetical protein
MDNTTKTPQQILLDAIDVIEQRGWCQGAFQDDDSKQVCMLGAIRIATWDKVIYPVHPAYAQACNATGMNGTMIAQWNDASGRTKEEVIAKLREAAQLSTDR